MSTYKSKTPSDEQMKAEEKTISRSVRLGFITLTVLTVAYWNFHESFGCKSPTVHTPSERLSCAVRLLTFSIINVFISIIDVIICRVGNAGATNPLSGNERFVEKANRILLNTVQQIILHIVNVIVFSVVISPDYLFLIPYLIFLFTFGRIIYWAGYTIDPMQRGTGFIFTFIPTFVVFIFNLLKVSAIL